MNNPKLKLATALTGCTAATALALAGVSSGAPDDPKPAQRDARDLMAHKYKVVREHGGQKADAAEIQKIKNGATGTGLGPIDGSTVRVLHVGDGQRVEIAMGPEQVCLVIRESDGSGSLGCTPGEVAADPTKLVSSASTLAAGKWRVSGLAPDDVAAVEVVLAGGAEEAKLKDNVFSAKVDEAPQGLRWRLHDGTSHSLAYELG